MPKHLTPEQMRQKQERFRKWQWTIGTLGTIGLFASLVLAFFGWGQKVENGGVKIAQVFVLVFWTLAPPIWFWFEYVFLFRNAFSDAHENKLDILKTQQELSSKIWIATASVLLILYFWKDIGSGR